MTDRDPILVELDSYTASKIASPAPYADYTGIDSRFDEHEVDTRIILPKTVPEPIEERDRSTREALASRIRSMGTRPTRDLLSGMEITDDPIVLWALHVIFHSRGVPPILRGPRHRLGDQGRFLDFCADVWWLQTSYLSDVKLTPKYRLMKTAVKTPPLTQSWFKLLARQYAGPHGEKDVRTLVIALNLSTKDRSMLRRLQPRPIYDRFEQLHGEPYLDLQERLLAALISKPDKSGKVPSRETAQRRALMWRIHELTGRSCAMTAKYWGLVTGETVTRQQAQRQIDAAKKVLSPTRRKR